MKFLVAVMIIILLLLLFFKYYFDHEAPLKERSDR